MRGLVIPVDGPARWTEWDRDGGLLFLLQREIDTDCVDSINLTSIGDGGLTVWVDDNGLIRSPGPPAYNDVALALVRSAGYPAGALAGTVVVTGGVDREGGTRGLSDRHVAVLTCLTDPDITGYVQAATAAAGPDPGPGP